MIEASGVSIAISGRRIVADVDLTLRPGSFTAIVGPNGSGKTTLLRALSGDIGYTGRIHVHGRELASIRPAALARLRAVLPQATALAFPFTVREVVRMGLIVPGASAAHDGRLVERALADVDLAGFGGRLYQELSGGEQQRVQLARVLCQARGGCSGADPRYLLLDEPVSSLDIRHQLAVMDIARAFAAAGGGVVAILHDLNLAAIYADTVVAMADGRIVASGPPREAVTDRLMADVFKCPLKVGVAPERRIFVLPQSLAP